MPSHRSSVHRLFLLTLSLALAIALTVVPSATALPGLAGLDDLPGGPSPVAAATNAPLKPSQFAHRLSAEMYGFLPYWEIDSGTDASLHYDLLTDIALYAVTLNGDGTINPGSNGYSTVTGPLADAIIAHAHAQGVRVDLTVTSFGLAHNTAFFSDPTAQAMAVSAIATIVTERGVDGVDLDVENLHNADFPAYAAWVGKVRAALRAKNPAARVSVATNANVSGGQMAAAAIKAGADRAFLMGYAYRSSGSSPAGSISPLNRTGSGLSLTWSLAEYASLGVPADRVLLGLPFYGMTWPTTSGAAHAPTDGSGYAFIPRTDVGDIPAGTTIGYDSVEQSPWFAVQDPTTKAWSETYYDNGRSLRAKWALVVSHDLAGGGIWALGYERGQPGFWDAIAASFGVLRLAGTSRYATAAAVSRATVAAGPPVVYVATGTDYPDALAGGTLAAQASTAMLLVTPTSIPTDTATELKRLKPDKIVVVGGQKAVSDTVLHALGAYAPGGVTRIAGADRYATAAAVSKTAFASGAPVAYLATGQAFADALSAGPAADHGGGPVLLTAPTTLSAATSNELKRLKPATVVIVGQGAAIASGVAKQVQAVLPGAKVQRVGGANRYATSALIAGLFPTGQPQVYVATGQDFPDALAGSAAAGGQDVPLLLTQSDVLPAVVSQAIVRLDPPRALVVGGSKAVGTGAIDGIRSALAAP
ncbi:MAG TPA: cell wall-binding repeat-containing protein [Candidatus Limnocylindrales bacterium]|nr:cell wall-binding repeat-containing protein [Candidatus Limnocylindrales bacterium]